MTREKEREGRKRYGWLYYHGRKNGILMKKTEKYGDFSSMIVKMLQSKETFPVS